MNSVTNWQQIWMAFRGALRPQSLRPAPLGLPLETVFCLSEEARQAWHDFFQVPGSERVPLLFPSSHNVSKFHRFLDQLGICFRNLVHLHSELTILPSFHTDFEPGRRYLHRAWIEDVPMIRADRAVVICGWELIDMAGQPLYRAREYFSVSRVSPHDAAALSSATGYGRTDVSHLRGQSRREAALRRDTAQPLSISGDHGMRYGRLSGDMNVVHTSHGLSRLFGFKRPFIQGLCTAQHALAALSAEGAVAHMAITYCRPVYVDQRVWLARDRERFELCDQEGRLLAAGHWQPLAPEPRRAPSLSAGAI